MSGGGHRASMWGAGALLAVCDAGLAPQVESISSVSGGSITNGVVAASGDMRARPDEATAALASMSATIADNGLFWFGPHTNRWVAKFLTVAPLAAGLLVGGAISAALASRGAWTWWLLLLLAGDVAVWLVLRGKLARSGMPVSIQLGLLVSLVAGGALALVAIGLTTNAHGAGRIVITWVVVLAVTAVVWCWLFALFAARGEAVDAAIAPTFLAARPGPKLADCDRAVHHVFCATDLMSGDQIYLTPRMVSGYRVGFGTPGDLPLSTAIQCSACLPGAFPPRVLANRGGKAFNFVRSYDLRRPGFPDRPIEQMMLNDGGVYDNMADQWHQGFAERSARAGWPATIRAESQVDLLILANAGGSLSWRAAVPHRWIRDVAGLKRTIDILYDVSTSHRRQQLVNRFDATASGAGMAGVLTHVRTSPVSVARRFAHQGDEATRRESRKMEEMLLGIGDEDMWFGLAARNAAVKTTLGRLPADQIVDLAWHAYVLTRVGLWLGHALAQPAANDLTRSHVEGLLRPARA